jgi:ferredoxin
LIGKPWIPTNSYNKSSTCTLLVITDRYIGCGLCASACPEDAILMVKRKAMEEPVKKNVQEMGAKILQEKGILEGFLKVMAK